MRIKRKNVTTPQKTAPSETKDPQGSTRSTSVCDESAPSPSITIIDYQDQPKVSHGSNSSASPDRGSTATPSGHKKPSRHGKTRNLRDCNSTEDKKEPVRPVKEEIKANSGRHRHHKASGSTGSGEPWEKEHLPPNHDKQMNQHWGADSYDRNSRDSTDPYEFVVNKVEGGTTSTVTLTAGQGGSKKKIKAVDKVRLYGG